jgi:hypothetical protein
MNQEPTIILRERERLHGLGFNGRAGTVLADYGDGNTHCIRIVLYEFANCPPQPYVELWEEHHGSRPARIIHLSELVHVAQNLGELELWQISGRDIPGRD